MLIRSQNKRKILDMQCSMLEINMLKNDVRIITYGLNNPNEEITIDLGSYSTEEKAIKVLDMIQNAYQCGLYYDHGFDDSAKLQRPYIFAENIVFQMPTDSEVEV